LPTPHSCDIEAFELRRAGIFRTAFAFARISNLRAGTKAKLQAFCALRYLIFCEAPNILSCHSDNSTSYFLLRALRQFRYEPNCSTC
jgi:hypothetical protein